MTARHADGPIVLVGLMGSGKSTVGGLVASALGRQLVDVDEVIEQQTGQTVRALWERGGERAYRPLERRVVLDALDRVPPVVLAAPAGVIEDAELAARLGQPEMFLAFLRGDPDVLAERVTADDQERPLVGSDPAALLRSQAADRNPRYERLAHVTIDLGEHSPSELAAMVVAARSSNPDRANR